MLDLNLLGAMRAGSDNDLQTVWVHISHRAAEIVSWINPREYVPYLDDNGAPIPKATMMSSCSAVMKTVQGAPVHAKESTLHLQGCIKTPSSPVRPRLARLNHQIRVGHPATRSECDPSDVDCFLARDSYVTFDFRCPPTGDDCAALR